MPKKPFLIKNKSKKIAVARLIKLAGNQKKLATLCNVSQQTVSYWLNCSIPAEYVPFLVEQFKPYISAKELRPDLFG